MTTQPQIDAHTAQISAETERVLRDFVRAASHLAGYRERLLWHMQDEEGLVLPRYRQAGGDETERAGPIREPYPHNHSSTRWQVVVVVCADRRRHEPGS